MSGNTILVPGSFFSEDIVALLSEALDSSESKQDYWLERLWSEANHHELYHLAEFIKQRSMQARFIGSVLLLSPFLRDIFLAHPHILDPLRVMNLADRLEILLKQLAETDRVPDITEIIFMQKMRRLKREIHGLIAIGDLSKFFTLEETTEWLSRLAQVSLRSVLRFLLREADRDGKIILKNPHDPELECGLLVFAMGKLGAYELNYSSDIDLILFFDKHAFALRNSVDITDLFSRMAWRLVHIMEKQTPDGYIFRVDLRLRPDPGATPLVLSTKAALLYYEDRGQNWERAVWIKARPVAGDFIAAEAFLKELMPFIWRKYLDYAAIADIHSIKRQRQSTRQLASLVAPGHNIKLGRGGIREIELFVQTQQLIAGGQFPLLRGRNTLTVLRILHQLGWISEKVFHDLCADYLFLRNLEHRIQMLHDEQTHIVPSNGQDFLSVAHMMGYKQDRLFENALVEILQNVEQHYAGLFVGEHALGTERGNLVFTGAEDDPETLTTLAYLGFQRVSDVSRIIRGWHSGRYRATRSIRARESLTELMPALLRAFACAHCPDEILTRFDRFLQGLPGAIQLFSLLKHNKQLLDMLVLTMGAAPRLSDIITQRPHVFDSMLDPTLFSEIPDRHYLQKRLYSFLEQAKNYEEMLDLLRIFAHEQRFLIGIRLLNHVLDGEGAAIAFSNLAELMIETCLYCVQAEFTRQYGKIAGSKMAILALGKLSSRELTADSDIDLILLYDYSSLQSNAEEVVSDGKTPLTITHYYTRFTQRLIAALSAPTTAGILYEVDLRLRPTGNIGPVAVSFAAFVKYYSQDAWMWEHMALTRARTIAGDPSFRKKLEQAILDIIALPRQKERVADAICTMRYRLAKEKPAKNLWDFKRIAGGIIDLESIAQYAILTKQVAFTIGQSTNTILTNLQENLLERHIILKNSVTGKTLNFNQIGKFYTQLSQITRLCLKEEFDPDHIPSGLLDLLKHSVAIDDMQKIEHFIMESSDDICNIFIQLIGTPYEGPIS